MDFNNYLFRCSQVGNFICPGKPLTKNQAETLEAYRNKEKLTQKQTLDRYDLELKEYQSTQYKLSEGQKKELNKLVYYAKYGREPEIENKYFTKGNTNEKMSRDLLSEVLQGFFTYDPERRSNEFIIGSRDIAHSELIIDIKTSYQFSSYYTHLTEKASDIYLYQLDGYMDLWGLKESILAFTLTDTPFRQIDDEIRRKNWKETIFDAYGNVYEKKIPIVKKIVYEHIYTRLALEMYCGVTEKGYAIDIEDEDDWQKSTFAKIEWFDDFVEIPKSDRVHLVYHAFDPVRIEQRNESIRVCRDYMNTVKVENNLNWK